MESIEQINKMLLEASSIAQVEKLLGYGKDTLRKKLNRQGYKFNKQTRQYESMPMEQDANNVALEEPPKKDITLVVTPSYQPKEFRAESSFSNEQIEILHKIVKAYELKEKISITDEEKGGLANRNVRVYVDHFNKFSNWCKSMNLTQADGLYEAINVLMKKYE